MTAFDCALFDIDGVLVDIRKSYNEAIKKTVEFVLGRAGVKCRGLVTDQLILRFRQTGGFNNDADTSYAIALAALANPQGIADARRFLFKVAGNADDTGIVSVEKFLSGYYDISRHKEMLAYPAPVKDSYVGRVFDELFYGPALFKKQNGVAPKYCRPERPLIANDRLAVSKSTMKVLKEKLGDLGIVSGRSRLAAEYSLAPIMRYFNPDACVFLEDEKREYAKPNPYAVKKAMSAIGASSALYAGDSAEDMMMARRAQKEAGYLIAFVGIYGHSPQPARTVRQFREEGADAVARNVDLLPKLLNKVKPA